MAEKIVFFSSDDAYYEEQLISYDFYPGFAMSQKQKSITSLHKSIKELHPKKKVLEISTKSKDELGIRLSAFNLMFFHDELRESRHIENVFQSSKVFENGGPYRELLDVAPKDAKRDERLKTSGKIVGFDLYDKIWPLEPKTMFYDWIYIKALLDNYGLAKGLLEYDVFTDIEFNHKKQINCQARAAAIFVSLYKQGELEEKMADLEVFKTIYDGKNEGEYGEQMSMII